MIVYMPELIWNNGPFEYKFVLSDVLCISVRHISEYSVWSATLGLKNEKSKLVTIELEPDEMFTLFESYVEGTLSKGVVVAFPTSLVNEYEYIRIMLASGCIGVVINVRLTMGSP